MLSGYTMLNYCDLSTSTIVCIYIYIILWYIDILFWYLLYATAIENSTDYTMLWECDPLGSVCTQWMCHFARPDRKMILK
jgi:hypothetical protein